MTFSFRRIVRVGALVVAFERDMTAEEIADKIKSGHTMRPEEIHDQKTKDYRVEKGIITKILIWEDVFFLKIGDTIEERVSNFPLSDFLDVFSSFLFFWYALIALYMYHSNFGLS